MSRMAEFSAAIDEVLSATLATPRGLADIGMTVAIGPAPWMMDHARRVAPGIHDDDLRTGLIQGAEEIVEGWQDQQVDVPDACPRCGERHGR